MTVVTALAVSWNPLINSKAKATSRAMVRKISGPAGTERAESQKFIHVSVRKKVTQRVIRSPLRQYREVDDFAQSSQLILPQLPQSTVCNNMSWCLRADMTLLTPKGESH